LKRKVDEAGDGCMYDVELTYITSRGKWYFISWKGDITKSGGIATNIGVHFYDMLSWIFGELKSNTVHLHEYDRAAGFLEFEKARVRWFLSINAQSLPAETREKGKRTYRSLTINGESFEFSDGFTELHTHSYRQILSGNGFGLEEARPAIEIVHDIRTQTPIGLKGEYHPFARLPLSKHPFG
jgi:UDP-N-acetyl-2-amino-2-deoxyglucuronate dehydrogenase